MDKINSTSPSDGSVGVILALDVGASRIGVARATTFAGIASPLTFLNNTDSVIDQIKQLVQNEQAVALVVGLPRGLDGQETDQTRTVQTFAATLKQNVTVPMFWQDEALTSKQAETELEAKGKPFTKGDVDALAACYILQDYLITPEKVAV